MSDLIQAFQQHLENRPEGLSPYTIRGYLGDLNRFAVWFHSSTGESMNEGNVTAVDIRNYKQHLQTVKNYKPATINRRLAAIRAYFSWATEEGLADDFPVRVRNVEEPDIGPRALNEKQSNDLLRAAQKYGHKRDVAIIQVLRHTGVRVGELCSLTLSDIKISARKGTLTIRSGKGGRYREIPLNLDVRRALKAYLRERPQVEDPSVFIGQRKNGLTAAAVHGIVKKYARLADLEDVTPHVLRHTFGKSLLDHGEDLVTVQRLLGHKRLDSTARYTQPSKQDLETAVSKLELEEV